MNKFSQATAIALFAGLGGLAAHAQVLVDVDFNVPGTTETPTQTGKAVLGLTNSDIWNGIDTVPTNVVLNDVGGNATSVKLSATSSAGGLLFFDDKGYTAMDTATTPLMEDEIYGGSTATITLTLAGLSSYVGDTFQLAIYSSGDSGTQTSNMTLTGATGGPQTLSTEGPDRKISSGAGDAYQLFTGTIDTGGTLTIAAVTNHSTNPVFNGFQLEIAIPEPGTTALLASGLLGLGAWLYHRRLTSKA